MQNLTTLMVVTAGLFFSMACALLIEELLFGGLFRLFFARQAGRTNQGSKRTEGGKIC